MSYAGLYKLKLFLSFCFLSSQHIELAVGMQSLVDDKKQVKLNATLSYILV